MTHILTERLKTQGDSLQVLPNCPAAADSNGPLLIHKYFSAPDIFGEDAALGLGRLSLSLLQNSRHVTENGVGKVPGLK